MSVSEFIDRILSVADSIWLLITSLKKSSQALKSLDGLLTTLVQLSRFRIWYEVP